MHIVFQHIKEFLDLVNASKDSPDVGMYLFCLSLLHRYSEGLGYYSEQAFESMHADIMVK